MRGLRNIDARVWRGEIPLASVYTAGVGGERFFRALKTRGEILGTRCPACDQVYVPARLFCERCFAELDETVAVGPEGTLASFTLCSIDRDGRRLEPPEAFALVRLDGATTVMLHRLLGVTDAAQVTPGARVRVVVRPKRERTGSIVDIEGFALV
jgi:uncharacterized OB-fold protein